MNEQSMRKLATTIWVSAAQHRVRRMSRNAYGGGMRGARRSGLYRDSIESYRHWLVHLEAPVCRVRLLLARES